ncbi:MAG: zinc ribbon domain-containing protein [Leptospirales bacterium]
MCPRPAPLADTGKRRPWSGRTYRCPYCGMEKDRDHNAFLNILRLGLQPRG